MAATESEARASQPRRRLLLGLFLILAAALYAPWLTHEFIWDDFVQISENPAVRDGVPLARYFVDRETTSTRTDYNTRIYRPLRNVVFRAVWRASDGAPTHRPLFFLGINLVLYLLGGVLVYLLCRRLARDEWAAVMVAGLWLLLPVHAEDVLYASALGDLLSFDLQLGGLLCAMRALDADEGRALAPALGALALFSLGVLVKEMAITSVLMLPVYVVSERRALLGAGRRVRTVALVGAHALLGMTYLSVRTAMLGRVGQEDVHLGDTLWGAAEAPWLILKYAKVTLMPLGHAPDYGLEHPSVPLMIGCALGTLALFAWSNLRGERGVRFGAWLFVLSLLPVLRLVPLWTLMADRFALVPSIGLALVGAGILARVTPARRPLAFGLAALLGVMWAAATPIEARRLRNDETLFAYGVVEFPESMLSSSNYGLTLLKRGEVKGALEHLVKAEALGSRDPHLYHHLAGALEAAGRYDEAMRAADRAIFLKPDYGNAYAQRAALRRRGGDLDGAQRDLDDAIRYKSSPGGVEQEAAALALARGNVAEALDRYRKLAERVGDSPLLWQHVAECALYLERLDEGKAALDRCLQLDPARAPCKALHEQLP